MGIAAIDAGYPGQRAQSGAHQDMASEFGGAGGRTTIEALEAVLEDFLKVLESGQASCGVSASSASASSEAMAPSVATASPVQASVSPSLPPSTTGDVAMQSGTTVNIDGGNANGLGVTEQVDNNTGSTATFGWENAQGQLAGTLDLRNGQSGTFDVNAAGADGTSARLIKLNADGSIPTQSNLDEQNVTTNPNGTIQSSPDVSEITAGNDPTKITITDGNGKTVGNGAPGGAYLYPTQDQQTDPANNPMTMAMDRSNVYNNDFTD